MHMHFVQHADAPSSTENKIATGWLRKQMQSSDDQHVGL